MLRGAKLDRRRFIKLDRTIIENIEFDSVEEFRTLFYLKVETDLFYGINEKFKSKVFQNEFMLFVFKHKKKCSNKKLNKLLELLRNKGVTKDRLCEEPQSYIILYDYEVASIKGIRQLYALLINKWAKDNNTIYFKKELFYKWFGKNTSDMSTVFKRAMKGVGLLDANYKIQDNKILIFRNKHKNISENPIQKYLENTYNVNFENIEMIYKGGMDEENYYNERGL